MLATAQVLVNAHGCAFAVANTVDDQTWPKYAVASGEDSRSRRHKRLRIDRNQSTRRNVYLVFGREEVETRRLADRHDDGVALDLALAVLVERGIEALVLIENPLGGEHFQSCNFSVFADDPLRPESGMDDDAFFFGFFNLFEGSRHLVAAFQANQVHLARAHAQCGK